MARNLAVVACVLLVGGLLVSAQEPQVNANNAVTVIGCVEREPDYRARQGDVGAWNAEQVVLSGAYAAAAPAIRVDYDLTGRLEPQLLNHVSVSVEIAGFVEDELAHEPPAGPVILPRLFVTSWQVIGEACPLL